MATSTILVATWREGLFAVDGDRRKQEITNQSVRGLVSDGRSGALAIVDGHSLRRRAPDGDWTTIATSEYALSCCIAAGEAIFAGTDDARLLQLSDEGSGTLVRVDGFDNVAGRETWFAGSAMVNGQRMGPPLGIRSLAASANGSILFANVHVGGIPRSMDGGRTWQPTIDINSDVHEVRAHPANLDLVVAAAAVGLCISRDAGATWTIERDGLHASYCSAVGFAGDDILVSASLDHFAAQAKLYRRPAAGDGGTVAVEGGMPAWTEGIVDTGCIATHGSTIAVVDRAGNLYCSYDGGRAWSCAVTGLPSPSGVLIP
jgi:photosystem II stability/assembly factor-like uncharacterized protein